MMAKEAFMVDDEHLAETSEPRRVGIRVEIGKPISFESQMPANDPSLPGADEARRIVRTLRTYRTALRDLVSTKYVAVAASLPKFYQQAANIFILRCTDGVLVRYDVCADDKPWTKCGSIDEPLEKIAPGFSDNFIHFPSDPATYHVGDGGRRLSMTQISAAGDAEVVLEIQPLIVEKLTSPATKPASQRPMPIVSVTSEIELQIGGHIEPAHTSPREIAHTEQFVGRARGVLSVGWQAIEVYPALPKERWDESLAPGWAECDLLAALAQRNFTDASFAQLDGRGEARRRYAALLAEFESLLAGHEEPIHQFLKRHPELISPTSVRRWSKVPFGSHVSDFVFLEPSDDYVLVEIEAAHRELFREDGQQRQELTHAINQILDWVQHIQDHKSDVEQVLPGISTSPRALVVIGRSAMLSDENRRKLTTIASQHGKLRIQTYDDVLLAARATLEQLLGPLDFETNMQMFFFSRAPTPSR